MSCRSKFEAGTPDISGVIGLGEAVKYIQDIGYEQIGPHEHDLLVYATEQLQQIDGLRIIGTAKEKASVISFLVDGVHPYDLGAILDKLGIAVRTGHHCTQPTDGPIRHTGYRAGQLCLLQQPGGYRPAGGGNQSGGKNVKVKNADL